MLFGCKVEKRYSFTLCALLGAIITTPGVTILDKWNFAPKQAYVQQEDLNQDGVPDLVIEQQNGHLVPMYGAEEEGKTIYISASAIMGRNPDSITDYKTIESRLNKQEQVTLKHQDIRTQN